MQAQYTGTILISALSYEPADYMICNGRGLPVNDYYALFQLLGNRFGGDGVNTFNLPIIPAENGVVYMICLDGIYPQPAS